MLLNKEQKKAIAHTEGPLLVLAGAGSGKTRVVTERIIHLLEQGIFPSKILGVTFTNKAAEEMATRIREKTSSRVLISTFHSLGARILRESIHHLGLPNSFTIYDEEDSNKLLKSILKSFNLPEKKGMVKGVKELISDSKNNLLSPDEVDTSPLTPAVNVTFQEIYRLYQMRLKESQAVDFDDLLLLPVTLFRTHPEVLAYYQERWQYLHVDEYQDTNQAQYELVKLLAGERKNLFVVGDPDQSIYSWRGATIRNILHFEKDFPGAETIRLEQNYRSALNILNAANALISYNEGRLEKNLWSDIEDEQPVELIQVQSERDEAETVAKAILDLKSRGHSFSEMAVFYRTNFQSRSFEDLFRFMGIPYAIYGGLSFYQRMEIKDVLAFLRMVHSSYDLIAFERTINLPKRGLGPKFLEKLKEGSFQEEMGIFDYAKALIAKEPLEHPLKLTAKQREGLEKYVTLIDDLRRLAGSSTPRDLIIDLVEKTHYFDLLKEDPETFNDRKSNVLELASVAAEWEEQVETPTLEEFLSDLTLKSAEKEDIDEEKVLLMTLHNSKGLEFETVFLVGLEEDLLPHVNCKDSIDQIEEERRLTYVGMTRAKKRLYLTTSRFRYMWGTLRSLTPSRFLSEIPLDGG